MVTNAIAPDFYGKDNFINETQLQLIVAWLVSWSINYETAKKRNLPLELLDLIIYLCRYMNDDDIDIYVLTRIDKPLIINQILYEDNSYAPITEREHYS